MILINYYSHYYRVGGPPKVYGCLPTKKVRTSEFKASSTSKIRAEDTVQCDTV